jgi:lipopolysaccharide export system permease protein
MSTAIGQQPQPDSLYAHMPADMQRTVVKEAARQAQNAVNDLRMKSDYTNYLNRQERMHIIEAIGKFTLALSCIIFFFIGAPLGAIIRKGGLGVPVIISVIVFIVYYIFENSGMRMARDDNWTIWFGKGISTMVLAPLAVFFTYKANSDSTVFNFDAYRLLFMRMFGLRQKRTVTRKEVIIEEPHYADDTAKLQTIIAEIDDYNSKHRLASLPNYIKVFFRPGDDQTIQDIGDRLEEVVDDLGNTRDNHVLHQLNNIPILATHAHTRPFRSLWLNAVMGIIPPLGLFFYFRMIRFRLRLHRDLAATKKACQEIIALVRL